LETPVYKIAKKIAPLFVKFGWQTGDGIILAKYKKLHKRNNPWPCFFTHQSRVISVNSCYLTSYYPLFPILDISFALNLFILSFYFFLLSEITFDEWF
jgi:hypothetical protein